MQWLLKPLSSLVTSGFRCGMHLPFLIPLFAGGYTKGTWWDTGIGQPWDSIPTILVWTVEACPELSEEGCTGEDESLPHGEAQRALPMQPLKGWQLPKLAAMAATWHFSEHIVSDACPGFPGLRCREHSCMLDSGGHKEKGVEASEGTSHLETLSRKGPLTPRSPQGRAKPWVDYSVCGCSGACGGQTDDSCLPQ